MADVLLGLAGLVLLVVALIPVSIGLGAWRIRRLRLFLARLGNQDTSMWEEPPGT